MRGSKPSTGEDSLMSRAMPWGSPSTMSMRTTSARPFCTTRMAVVAPTNPLPTTVTRMAWSPRRASGDVPRLRPERAHDPVAALHHGPADGAGGLGFLQVPVGPGHDVVGDDQAG